MGLRVWSFHYSDKVFTCLLPLLVIHPYSLLVPDGKLKFPRNLLATSSLLYSRGDCIVMKEVFASRDINNSGGLSSNSEETSGGTDTALAIPRTTITAHNLSNLKIMYITDCNSLELIFTFSTLESLTKLEVIRISECKAMKVIVREENGEQTVASKAVVFPRLEYIELYDLPNLEGFFLGKDLDISLPLVNTLVIKECPKLETFTKGRVATPELKVIETNLGLSFVEIGEQDINSFIITRLQEGLHFAKGQIN